jgi:hypothetical protein
MFSPRERNYCATTRELVSLLYAIKKFHQYLIGAPFIVKTDSQALQWLQTFKNPEGKMARWIEQISPYNFTVLHQRGKNLPHADALSRYPIRPCPKDCKTCKKLEDKEDKYLQKEARSVRQTRLEADPAWKPEAIRADQLIDPAIRPILEAKEANRRPEPDEAAALGSAARALWLQWASLELKDGVLYRRWEHPSGAPERGHLQLVLPYNRVQDVIRTYHATPGTGSHFKIAKTLGKIKERFYWPNAFQDCRDVIASCEQCARFSGAGRPRRPGPMRIHNDNTFLGRWCVDLAGPFPRPLDSATYKEAAAVHKKWYALVAVETFTCWPEVIVIHNQDARTCAQAIVDNIVSRYGAFTTLHSDQGRNWESAVFQEVLNLLQIKKTRTTRGYPKGNPRCERFIKSLIQHIGVVTSNSQRDWPDHIPLILLAYRTAQHRSTKISPAEMLYGRMLNLPADLVREPPPGAATVPNTPEHEYPRWLRGLLRTIHEEARINRDATSRKIKENYDVHSSIFPGQPGDMVWLYRPTKTPGCNPKLSRNWEGPYLILDRINELLVRIQHTATGKKRITNGQNVAKYTDPACPVRQGNQAIKEVIKPTGCPWLTILQLSLEFIKLQYHFPAPNE